MAYDAEQILSHFPAVISADIRQYADESVLEGSRYLFTRRQGRRQFAYCTNCHAESETSGLKHNDYVSCPSCDSRCHVKSSGRGRSKMIDEAYFVYYEKSTLSPDIMVARGFYVVRDYRGSFKDVRTQFLVKSYYLFEVGGSSMLLQQGFYSWRDSCMHTYGWLSERKSIFSLFSRHSSNGWGYNPEKMELDYCYESIVAAVKNTPFQYSTWQDYSGDDDDMVRFVDLYSKYPCIEYLSKLGMGDLVIAKLTGHYTYGAINWRGKTLQKVLRVSLTKQEVQQIKSMHISVTPLFLKLLQISRKDGSNLSIVELSVMAERRYSEYLGEILKMLQFATLRKMFFYMERQLKEKNPDKKHYREEFQVLMTWRDYVTDCNTLNMDLTQESVLFPANLYNAHQNTIRQIKIKEDAGLNKKIAARLKSLRKYCYSGDTLLIRPAESTLELIDEGKALHHCVGTYGQRYAKGETVILFIRKIAEPDKPYFTVEIQSRANTVMQVRGKNNCQPDSDVSSFVEAFVLERLGKGGNIRIQSRIMVPA